MAKAIQWHLPRFLLEIAIVMLQRFKGPEGRRVFVEALEMQPVIGGRPELAKLVCDSSHLESWAPGDLIMENGTPGNEIYFVLSGTVSIQVQGREVAVRQAGEQIGEMALLHPGQPRSATVVAIDETITARLAEREFSSLADIHPMLWRNLARILADRLRQRNRFVAPKSEVPVLFIGCSSESLNIAEALATRLRAVGIEVQVWNEGVFQASEFILESLETELIRADFAALVLSPDDTVTSRDATLTAPRDNVVFELGLFMGALGHARTFLVRPVQIDLKVPTDLSGLTAVLYSLGSNEDPETALAGACDEITSAVRSLGPR